jgi:intein/homing endonuclease
MADGSYRPISEIEVGSLVVATDPETGESFAKPVLDVIVGYGGKHLVGINVGVDSNSSIVATSEHPLWVVGRGWVPASKISVGDRLVSLDGESRAVNSVIDYGYQSDELVFNLAVGDLHTYYVLADETPLLVHNCNKSQGVYIFDDISKPGHVYVGKTDNFARRLREHADLGRREPNGPVICMHVCGNDAALRIREHIVKVQFKKMGIKLSSGIEGWGRNLYNKRGAKQLEFPF